MNVFGEFIQSYGAAILYALITAVAGFIGIQIKNLYEKICNDKTKKDVARTCVQAVEQIYKDLHGSEKYEKCVESISEMLTEKGIVISELEIKMLVEAAVAEFNDAFAKEDEATVQEATEASEDGNV